ncbi:unnamed protein product [Psylliodes chrysocephalus]|uniref:Major facilitator superfamily (MFS) profile domain-containing protein n=1 Tax=Psylliodes chrysocephalus TaxID=3402493 RepID=A0A9P0GIF1_9CUCU|nr:unnamed protein product [Psylliodes chrysocephala]
MAWYNTLTVEVPLFFTFVNFILTGSIFTNQVIYRTCYILLGYNKTDCSRLGKEANNDTKYLEKMVEPTADVILMYKSIADSLFPIFICMIAGPWSDKNGRKPVLLMTLIGIGLGGFIMIIFSYFENLNPWYFLIASIPSMLTGGGTTYFAITLSYLSDISTPETRGMRMAFYEAALNCGVLLGSVLSSYIFYATNYESVFAIGTGSMLIGIVYTIFLIPESLPMREGTADSSENSLNQNRPIVGAKYFIDMVYTAIKKRENYDRAIILLTVCSIIMYTFQTNGDYGIQFIFLRHKLNWTLTKYTLYFAAINIIWVIGTMSGTIIFYKKLKFRESVITIVGLTFMIGYATLQLLAKNDIYIYSAGVLKSIGSLVNPMLRSQVSKMVPPNEVGKIFSVIVAGGALIALGASPAYTFIYNATINIDSAYFNFLSIGLLSISGFLVIIILMLERKSKSVPLKNEETKSESPVSQ